MKHSFRNDYGRFAHPRILCAILAHGEELNDPYGLDAHSKHAGELIAATFGVPEAEVHFFTGGTMINRVFLSYVLKPYEAVVCCDSAHINVHETGAIEGSGHKVLAVPGVEGKITVEGIEHALRVHTDEHMVLPRAVYLSDATETGTLYTKAELLALKRCCESHGLYLYLDGARLAVALTSVANDIRPEELGPLCDAFYVGGGKDGIGIGEALVLVNPALKGNFRHHIKNQGAMLAKGYLLGIEFEEAFKDGLFFELGKKANAMASRLIETLRKKGYHPAESPTNQVFCLFEDGLAKKLIEEFGCEIWSKEDEGTCLRFVTSYATSDEDLQALEQTL